MIITMLDSHVINRWNCPNVTLDMDENDAVLHYSKQTKRDMK